MQERARRQTGLNRTVDRKMCPWFISNPRRRRFTSRAQFSESGLGELEKQLHHLDPNELKQLIKKMVPEYTPYID